MKWKKIKAVFKERWKFYLVGYLFGFFASLISDGIQSWKSLFPIKLAYIICGIVLGTAFYYGKMQTPVFVITFRSLKYIGCALIVMCIFAVIRAVVLRITGYDISFLIGF